MAHGGQGGLETLEKLVSARAPGRRPGRRHFDAVALAGPWRMGGKALQSRRTHDNTARGMLT
eukprot:4653098-Prymnesium_polylepis.1